MNNKGAIQLSLGFIVAVVFAVVLLSLAVTWLQGIIIGIGTLTDDLTQKAHDTLSETFNRKTTNFAVYPKEYRLDPGRGIKLSVGVNNDDRDGQPHNFVIRLYPAMASSDIISTYGCSSFAGCSSLNEDMISWVTYSHETYRIQPNTYRFWDMTVTFPNNIVKGTYQYDIVSCEDMDYSNCDRATTNWGSTLSLTITAQ
ncbi:MAG: hypothetical protein GTN38_00845 [Candidatus Aenigmarchaeota archaeon]|nr:hypothetical protein [Candidatus Aenigmarchaeota archaeon]NIP40134.1 hypothetical protein [Candidatus Aenigmarchaeota archaeon]NIQ18211.1 hypothetical protein [Candidatus Aenigmarchaeota archaeon]NIS72968.1 hypothetical protein [Candidatus Aenigmarchaeota archaeon]